MSGDTAGAGEREQSVIRSFIYGMWGHAGDERVRPTLAALDALVAAVREAKAERDVLAESMTHMWAHLGASDGVAADLVADELARKMLVQAVDDVTTDHLETLERLQSALAREREAEARAERAERALGTLVRLKDGPRDEAYEAAKPAAWEAARAAVSGVAPTAPARHATLAEWRAWAETLHPGDRENFLRTFGSGVSPGLGTSPA